MPAPAAARRAQERANASDVRLALLAGLRGDDTLAGPLLTGELSLGSGSFEFGGSLSAEPNYARWPGAGDPELQGSAAALGIHAGDDHKATQWQIDEATGDFSSPLEDSGEDATNLLSYEFDGLTAQTVYRIRARTKDNGQDLWGEWAHLEVRTPEFTGGQRVDFYGDEPGGPPTGFLGDTGSHFVRDDRLWAVNPDGSTYAYRIIDPRQFILSLNFDL